MSKFVHLCQLPVVILLVLTSASDLAGQSSAAEDPPPSPQRDATITQLLEFCRKYSDEAAHDGETPEEHWRRVYIAKKSVLNAVDRILRTKPSDGVLEEAIRLKFDALHRLADPGVNEILFRDSTEFAEEYRVVLREFAETQSNSELPSVRRQSLIFRAFSLAPGEEQRAKCIVQDVERLFDSQEPLPDDYHVAVRVGWGLETLADLSIAADAYSRWGERFAGSSNQRAKQLGERLIAASRRMRLPGNSIKIAGTTIEDGEFGWASYRGKVVLLYCWFTTCPPCRESTAQLKALYREYHGRGFDIVGINVDAERKCVQEFVDNERIPWTNIWEGGEADQERMLVTKFYGIDSYPTKILIDQAGVVLQIDVDLETLPSQLRGLLNAPDK